MIQKKLYPKSPPTLIGIIKKHPDEFGFFIPDDSTHPDVYLSRKQARGLMSNDKIKIAVYNKKDRYSGTLLQIIQRAHLFVIGSYIPITSKTGLVKDQNSQWGEDLKVHLTKNQTVKKGTWIQIKILYWPNSRQGFTGEMICSLGEFPQAWEDTIRIVQQYNIPAAFSVDCLKASEVIPEQISKKDIQNRKDLSSYPFVTIDGKSAKDFDDAIYVSSHSKGSILYVAIADVSHYVKKGSILDKEAYQRGNSTYFPSYTFPMLPEKLSNNLCSLKPHQKRLAFVAEIHFDSQSKKTEAHFYEAIIKSHHRFTYEEIENIKTHTVSAVLKSVLEAKKLAQKLLDKRLQNNFINLNIPETEITLNTNGEPINITQTPRLFAHQLIEELMLATNKAVAEYIFKNKLPSLYRIHDLPKKKSLKFLELFVQTLGVKMTFTESHLQRNISSLIKKFSPHPLFEVLQILVLRSLSQAVYSAQSKAHFGLNTTYYTHFTSPIRRYSDLIVHRVLKTLIYKKPADYNTENLNSMATIISACEQRSVKAERQIKNIKKARFIKKYLGKEMTGTICSITRFGFFVKLNLFDIDGLVHIDTLLGQWEFEESLLELKSKVTKKIFKIGDLVLIQVVASNIYTGQIDFGLKEHNKQKINQKPKLKRKKNLHKFKRSR